MHSRFPPSCRYDHTCKLWDLRQHRCLMQLDHGAPIESVAFFPTGLQPCSTCVVPALLLRNEACRGAASMTLLHCRVVAGDRRRQRHMHLAHAQRGPPAAPHHITLKDGDQRAGCAFAGSGPTCRVRRPGRGCQGCRRPACRFGLAWVVCQPLGGFHVPAVCRCLRWKRARLGLPASTQLPCCRWLHHLPATCWQWAWQMACLRCTAGGRKATPWGTCRHGCGETVAGRGKRSCVSSADGELVCLECRWARGRGVHGRLHCSAGPPLQPLSGSDELVAPQPQVTRSCDPEPWQCIAQ